MSDLAALLPVPSTVILIGAYGSGKTECALALAAALVAAGPATLVEMDFVTPYFRVLDHQAAMMALGVHVVAPEGPLAQHDAPALPAAAADALLYPRGRTVVDLGGDPAGALVIAQFAPRLPAGLVWGVVNCARPTTATPDTAAAVLRATATAARLRLTGLISNTVLGPDTTAVERADGLARAQALAALLDVPVVLQTAPPGVPAPAGPPVLTIRPRLHPPWA